MSTTIINSGFFAWCMDVLHRLEAARTPLLDKVMSVLTVLGEEMAFIVIGLVIIWCIDKKFGYRFIFMYMLGTAVNQILKAVFMIPRPWVIDKNLTIVESARDAATGFSFPSGHTQSAVLMYGGIASGIKKKGLRIAIWILAALLMLGVGFSRMYLGVHTPLDVGVSYITGVIILALVMGGCRRLCEKRGLYLLWTAIVGAAVIGLIVFIGAVCKNADIPCYTAVEKQELIASSAKDAWTLLGTVAGLFLGYAVETRFIDYSPKAAWWAQIIKVVVGLAVIIALRILLKNLLGLLSESPAMNGVRYFILSFVGLAVLPLLFRPLAKTAKKDKAEA